MLRYGNIVAKEPSGHIKEGPRQQAENAVERVFEGHSLAEESLKSSPVDLVSLPWSNAIKFAYNFCYCFKKNCVGL